MGDFNSSGKWDVKLTSILPLPTEDEIFDDSYSTAQVMDMRYHIDALEAKVKRQADALRKISDIAETGNAEWVIEAAEAALLEDE